ncbi:MAG TPA: hypothetical protein VH814_18285 [Steroidobacteraceae bacterium]|jgi:hypothetical protein
MNARWHRALRVAVLALAAGCSRHGEFTVCDSRFSCKTYPSKAAMQEAFAAEEAADAEKQRRYAHALPFDYRDLVHVLLVDYLRPSGIPDVNYRNFVGVFGSDIDVPLTAKLHESKIEVLPASAWTLGDMPSPGYGRPIDVHFRVDVYDLKQIEARTYTVWVGYYCGSLCSGSVMYTLRQSGKTWRIIARERGALVS